MNGYKAFVKKELTENIRNFRLLIMLVLFLVFGILSPLIAKYSSEVISTFAPSMKVSLAAPTALDSWEQFYKNVSGMGFSAFIILFGSCMSNEYSRGTLIIMLTKGLSRPAVILSKFTAAAAVMTLCFWASFCTTYGYTAYLWQDSSLSHTFSAALAQWFIALLYLSILLLGCVLFRQTFTSILFTGGVVMIISLLGMVRQIERFSPFVLTTKNMDLLSGKAITSDFVLPVLIAAVLLTVFLSAAVVLFNKKQL